jgi:tRNA synthetases class II (A)
VYGLAPERIWVSVYEDDEEAYDIWRDGVGVPPARIQRLGAADNFWESGATGADSVLWVFLRSAKGFCSADDGAHRAAGKGHHCACCQPQHVWQQRWLQTATSASVSAAFDGGRCAAAGPCGPCTELYYDFAPDAPSAGASVADDSRFIEFYNLVLALPSQLALKAGRHTVIAAFAPASSCTRYEWLISSLTLSCQTAHLASIFFALLVHLQLREHSHRGA